MRRVFYTGDLITPDDTDTDVYGAPTLEGYGATLASGWVDPDWTRWAVYENRDDVRPDVMDDDDEREPAKWLADTIADRLGWCEDNGGWFSAVDSVVNYSTGDEILLSAHPDGFTEEEIARASELMRS